MLLVIFQKNLDENPSNFTMPKCMPQIEYWNILLHFNFSYHPIKSGRNEGATKGLFRAMSPKLGQ